MVGVSSSVWPGLILLGLCAGLISGMLGLGSGTIIIPVLTLAFCFPQKSAQGTALAVMVPMAALAAFLYWRSPGIEVDLRVVALMAGGAMLGAAIGYALAERIPGSVLRKIFAVYLLVVALKILTASNPKQSLAPERPADSGPAALIMKEDNGGSTTQ